MNILALDTSTSLATVALVCNERVVASSLFSADRCLSARLVPEIERLLEAAGVSIDGIDLFAGAIGPGSFTGVRAGIATLQGLALATGKSCTGFSTLALLAMNFPLARYPVCAMLDARKSEVYAALYDCSSSPLPTALIKDCVMTPEQFLTSLRTTTNGPVIFAGEGALRYRDIITATMEGHALFANFPQHAGHAANGALLALEQFLNGQADEPAKLLPIYIRASEAEYAKISQQPSRKTAHVPPL